MHPVHLFGKDGGYTVLPLAWINPMTAAWADHAIVRADEALEPARARSRSTAKAGRTRCSAAWARSGRSTAASAPGPRRRSSSATFPTSASAFWRRCSWAGAKDAAQQTLFESRYTRRAGGLSGASRTSAFMAGRRRVPLRGQRQRWLARPDRRRSRPAHINTRLAVTARVGGDRCVRRLADRLPRFTSASTEYHPSDGDLVHLTDGLADHREGVVADLAVGHQIIGTDQIAVVDIGLGTKLVDLMVRVDSSAMSSKFVPSTPRCRCRCRPCSPS